MPLFVYCNGVISVKRCSVVRKVTDFLSCSFFNDRTTSIALMQFQKYFFLDLFSLISISSSQKQNKHYILGKNVYVDLIFSFCNIFVAWSFLGRIRFLILKTAHYQITYNGVFQSRIEISNFNFKIELSKSISTHEIGTK